MSLDLAVLDSLKQSIPAADLPAIYRAFAADLARLSAEFSAHTAAGRDEAARCAAHALAGTAAGVGAKALEALARRTLQPGAPSVPADAAAAIAAETESVVAQLNALAGG
ncbi:MAG: hypothetical protein NZM27_07500 [Acetobacteraceae bacterium]|nr:hypothetical protein [Acetobacteraceae bacterium]MDW8398862.1 hypothetical protein [Acetobacteraceae bacterium]